VTGYQRHVQSGSRDALGGIFTDVWRCYAKMAPGDKQEFIVQTVPDTMSTLKNTMQMESVILIKQGELGWDKIKHYFV